MDKADIFTLQAEDNYKNLIKQYKNISKDYYYLDQINFLNNKRVLIKANVNLKLNKFKIADKNFDTLINNYDIIEIACL